MHLTTDALPVDVAIALLDRIAATICGAPMTTDLSDPDDETWPEHLYPAAERHFAAWITDMNGWVMAETVASSAGYQKVADRWLGDGRLTKGRKDHFDTVELTDAGRAWCRENGAG